MVLTYYVTIIHWKIIVDVVCTKTRNPGPVEDQRSILKSWSETPNQSTLFFWLFVCLFFDSSASTASTSLYGLYGPQSLRSVPLSLHIKECTLHLSLQNYIPDTSISLLGTSSYLPPGSSLIDPAPAGG